MRFLIIALVVFGLIACSDKNDGNGGGGEVAERNFVVKYKNVTVYGTDFDPKLLPTEKAKVETILKVGVRK